MLTEADLHRIKGLLHYLNSGLPTTRDAKADSRRLQLAADAHARIAAPTVRFDVAVRNDEGITVGYIMFKGNEYVFGVKA